MIYLHPVSLVDTPLLHFIRSGLVTGFTLFNSVGAILSESFFLVVSLSRH